MDINPHNDLHRDLLTGVLPQTPPRSALVPLWLHISMGLLVPIYLLCIAVGIASIHEVNQQKDMEFAKWFTFGMILYLVIFACMAAGCILMWCSWQYAPVFAAIPALPVSFVLLLAVFYCMWDTRMSGALIFFVPFTSAHICVNIRLFLMNRQWKMSPRQ